MATQAARLWLPVGTNNSYHQALSIPLHDFQHFSLNGFHWLRYVASTIYGREGYISSTPSGTEIDEGEHVGPNKYYYVSQKQALLLDPDLMDDRTSITTAESTSRDDFKQRVTARDETCVLTRGEEHLVACHVVPHAKTHRYMANLSNHRGEGVDPPLDDINDTRNGILLYSPFHRAFGESRVAFLRTPNFAMAVTDVGRVAQPGVPQPMATVTERLTFQHFNTNDRNLAILAPHNCGATIADSEWPPDLIFDVAYGCAALGKWGTPQFIQFAQRNTYKIYYEGDNGDDANVCTTEEKNGRAEHAPRRVGPSDQANAAAEVVPDFHDMVLGLWMHSAKKGQRTADAAKVDKTTKEVQAWLGSVV